MAKKTSSAENHVSESAAPEDPEVGSENLSTKISKLPVLNDSLRTVSKTCKGIREMNSCVGYGMTVAESSLDKAFQAGKSVLDSSTLAPITNTAIENFRYLDKEAGNMLDKIFKPENGEALVKNGEARHDDEAVQELSGDTQESSSIAAKNESMVGFLGRKIYEVTTFLILFPKYAIASIFNLWQPTSESNRKRKERSSSSGETKNLEPSPVKRKYGDRQSSSDDDGDLIEMLHVKEGYNSEEDPDYEPPEQEPQESEDDLTQTDEDDVKNEAEYLKENLKKSGISLEEHGTKMLSKEGDSKPSPATEAESLRPGEKDEADENKTKQTKEEPLKGKPPTGKHDKVTEKVGTSKESEEKTKENAEKDEKTTPGKEIDPSSKSRRSSKSPLLGKLLSPSRRRSQRKSKSEKEAAESVTITEEAQKGKSGKSEKFDKSEKGDKSEKAKGDKSDVEKSKADQSGKSEATEGGKSEKSDKTETTKHEESHSATSPLSAVTGAFDVFKMGGKKSK